MTITLPPDLEHTLTERAEQQGTTPELLALHDLRERVKFLVSKVFRDAPPALPVGRFFIKNTGVSLKIWGWMPILSLLHGLRSV